MKTIKLVIPILLFCVVFTFPSQAQKNDKSEQVFRIVDEMPIYPGGEDQLRKDVAATVKYPAEAKKNKEAGKVIVSFAVNEKGKMINKKIAKSVSPLLDKEALRVIGSLKTWKPGKHMGTLVKVEYNVPINFALN